MFPDDFTDDERIDNDPRCRSAFDRTWQELQAGATSGNPFNLLQLATINERDRPEVRTIVLRDADSTEATLYFVTDSRSPKMDDFDHERNVALVGYDPASRVQIRLTGIASTVGDYDMLSYYWSRLSEMTRASFNAPVAPGTRLLPDGSLPSDVRHDNMSAFERFCPIRVDISDIDRLDISRNEHVRFCFKRTYGGWLGGRRAP